MGKEILIFNDEVEKVIGKHEAKIDIPVLLIFFNRAEKISQVFEQVKKARPTRLYLYQDGAREGREDDTKNVELCRQAVSDINWNCEVHRLYQQKNYGCDPSEFIAQKWMFNTEEMGIVLEDDDVPSQSLFPFFKELLERYKDDTRIAIICGMNNFDVTENVEESYFFSKRGAIWGWASWKRFIDLWDGDYSWCDDEEKCSIIEKYCDYDISFDSYIKNVTRQRATGREFYESIMFAAAALNNMLNIVPKYNMISNIGIDKETTHSVSDIRLLPKRIQKLMYKKTYEIEFPLIHPTKVERNHEFDKKYIISKPQHIWDRMESCVRKIIYKKGK